MGSTAEGSEGARTGQHAWREVVAQGQIAIGSDVPQDGAGEIHLKLPIRVLGWAYSRSGIKDVEIVIDGETVRAQYGLFRRDVADALAEQDAVRSGFAALLEAEACGLGRHTLAIVARDGGAQAAELRIPIVVDEQADVGTASVSGLDNEGERYVPEDYRDTYTEVEHQARYNWAAQLAAGREVLDAGCGVGWGTVRLAEAGTARAVGVDIDQPALASARERAGGRAEFVKGDLLALPFGDASFDFVVCFEAIEHVSDPQRALDELRRVIRPGGRLAVSSPNRGVYPAGNPHHLHELTSQELEESLRSRFANVTMYRQQTHLAALLTDDGAYADADPAIEVTGHLYKTSGGAPGDELYTIGLASDGPLPPLDGVAVLGAMGLHEHVSALEHEAMLAAAKSAAARTEADAARERSEALARSLEEERRAREEVEGWLEDLRASLSWRVTSPLRAAKRAARGNRSGSG